MTFFLQMTQESPPAWTQEAYRPPCRKYSLCCPILADPPPQQLDLTPSPSGWTWPSPRQLDLIPLAAGPDPPRQLDLTPPASWTWLPPVSWTWPPPSAGPDPPCGQTDRHVSKHYLPHPSDAGGKNSCKTYGNRWDISERAHGGNIVTKSFNGVIYKQNQAYH